MNKLILFVLSACFVLTHGYCQSTFELTFTAQNDEQQLPLDSIFIENLTLGVDTTLYAPDTVLILDIITSIDANEEMWENSFSVSQNYPNPFTDQTNINVYLPKEDDLKIAVYNLLGEPVAVYNNKLNAGLNTFIFKPGNERCYIFSATWLGKKTNIKMFNFNHNTNNVASLNYNGVKTGENTTFKKDAINNNTQIKTSSSSMPPAITIEPANATAYDELTMIFDPAYACSQNGSLAGLPFIAMHSGVTLFPLKQWQHVVHFINTGANGQPTHLQPTGDDRFAITFTPSEFYGFTDETVTQICAVFNNGTNWDQDGRDFVTGGSECLDFFIPLKFTHDFVFYPGNELRYTGYAEIVDEVRGSDVIVDAPESNQNYEFEITVGIPCQGTPTVTYDGQVYNTVQVGDQCWLKENLNIGTMIPGETEMEDNGLIEKYCYNDHTASCITYGGLYQWNELMKYTTTQGAQGICPPHWHLPTDEEWKILEGNIDSQFAVGDPEWDKSGWRGYDAGRNLKDTDGWAEGGNGSNLFGFTVFPSGLLNASGNFCCLGEYGYFWSSTEFDIDESWFRYLDYLYDGVYRKHSTSVNKNFGFSVRCIKD